MIDKLKIIIKEIIFKLNDFKSKNLLFNREKEIELRKKGYFIIKNFINKEECDAIKTDIDFHSLKDYCWRDKYDSDIRIFGIENVEDKFLNIFNRNNLLNIYKKYISVDKLYQTVMAAKMTFNEENIGSGGGWHRDTSNKRQLKFILYLCEVSEDNGCFQYIEKSHLLNSKFSSAKILKNNFISQRYSNNEANLISNKLKLKIKSITGSKGTLIVVDTSGLHRGKPMNSGTRYALTNYMSEAPFGASISDLIVSKNNINK
jgi:hypothetical protein